MKSGSTWRVPVVLGVSLLVAFAVALSMPTVGAAPETTPVSGPPNTNPTPTPPPALHQSLSLDPGRGPVGTGISYVGACGVEVRAAGLAGGGPAWGAAFGPEAGAVASVHSVNVGIGTSFDSPRGLATFHGSGLVPANLLDGTAVTPGLYYVNAGCLCDHLTSCPGGIDAGIGPGILLAPQPFCVTPPHPTFYESICLDDSGWLTWFTGHLGVGRFLAAEMIGLMSGQSSGPFALPLPPPPQPPTTPTTPTTRHQQTTTTTAAPPPTQPATTTTTCVKNPKPPPVTICG